MDNNAIRINSQRAVELGLETSIVLDVIRSIYEIGDILHTNNLKTHEMFSSGIKGFDAKSINRKLKKLVENGYIVSVKLSSEEVKQYLMGKDLGQLGHGSFICPWCNGKTIVPHEHHYPISKEMGGTEIIKICPTCHYEYHSLIGQKVFRVVKF